MEEDSASVASDMTQQQGWGQWMWSYVPQILPEGTEEGEDQENITRKKPVPPVLAIGMYGHKISIIFKVKLVSLNVHVQSVPLANSPVAELIKN